MEFCWFYQNDLLQLFQPFGVITKLVMLRAKNQVFFHLFCIMVKTVIYLLTLAKFFVLISFIMSAFCIGSSPNARCSFSHQCSAILHECAANHQVKIYMYILNICLEPYFEDDYDIYYFKYGLWMFWAVNCNLWPYMSDFIALTFQGKECLCPIFITSGTNNNGTECSRTRWWGWYLILMYWGQISFTWLLFRKKDWTGQSFFSFLWQWSFYHSGFYRICCLMVSPCMLRTIH